MDGVILGVGLEKRYLKESLGIAEVGGNIVGEAEPLGLVQGLVVEYTSLSENVLSQKWPYKVHHFEVSKFKVKNLRMSKVDMQRIVALQICETWVKLSSSAEFHRATSPETCSL